MRIKIVKLVWLCLIEVSDPVNLSYMFRVLGLFGVMNLHPVDRA